MSRRLKGLLLVFGLAIVFGVVSGGNVYARYDENDVSGDSCFKFYYSEDKGKKGLSTNEVCQDSSGKLSVTSSTTSPRFTVSGDEVCLTIPGKVDSCKTLIKSADGTRKFNEAFINSVIEEACGSTKTCKWTGSDRKTHTYYVSVNEPVNTSNSGGSSGSSGSGGGSSGGSEDEDVVPDEDEPTCMNSGAAQSLGWIVCPVLNLLSNAAEEAYTDYVEPALRVEPTLFSQNENDGTRQAWGVFQGFANILFIILLLVVIFSQLTGVGIDNYGIKKILPKLIVAAVLINLSYLICLIFIDLSNIVGNGIKSIFDGLSTGQLPQSIEIGGGENKGEIVLDKLETSGKTALTGVVILVAVVAQIWSAVAAEGILGGIILPLVLAAISVVIAIFFLFLLLATRQAAVVALTVISPLAFACYILPNTKRLFDKWVKLGWALVLVYPICGLLVGGGDYVSRLLLSAGAGSGGFAMAFMAMIVGVVPIFFIPSVLKSSLAAAGNIGAKISSIGSRVRGGAARGIKGNELYKRAQERGRENAARSFAGFNRDGSQRKVGRIGRLLRGGERGMARARVQYREDLQKSGARDELMNDEVYGARLKSDRATRVERGYQEQFANMSKNDLLKEARNAGNWRRELGDDDADAKMRALVTAMESNGLEGDIFEMLKQNDVGNRASVMQHLAQSKNKVLRAYGKTGGGMSYNSFMEGGGMQSYIDKKGLDFLDGLDDKALAQINSYSNANRQLMNTDMLVEAAARMKSEDARTEINSMLAGRKNINVSASQLANFGDSTMEALNLEERAKNDSDATFNNFKNAATNISGNVDLRSKIGGRVQEFVNGLESSQAPSINNNLSGTAEPNQSFNVRNNSPDMIQPLVEPQTPVMGSENRTSQILSGSQINRGNFSSEENIVNLKDRLSSETQDLFSDGAGRPGNSGDSGRGREGDRPPEYGPTDPTSAE